ncbi:MAG: zinc ribbon domain-containing protein [Deltaproteobacteria bacterium]|nr:zinc ribbon domain-containing protein [Deltaproteobacteria bacterium]
MPIYEYECGTCGKFEVLQKISEDPLSSCETCGKPVHRLVSLSSFALVGGGWYKDLYSSTPNKASSASDSSAPAPSSTSSASESKPAKPEKKTEKASPAAA